MSSPQATAESIQHADPDNWKAVRVHTALCEVCNQRNDNVLYKCRNCSWSICTPCLENRNGDRGHRNCLHRFSPTSIRTANASSSTTQPTQFSLGPAQPVRSAQGPIQPVQAGRDPVSLFQSAQGPVQQAQSVQGPIHSVQSAQGHVQQARSSQSYVGQAQSAPRTQSLQTYEPAPEPLAQDNQRVPRSLFPYRHTKRTYESSNTAPASGTELEQDGDSEEGYVTESEDESDYEKTEKKKRSGTRRPRKDGLPNQTRKRISKRVLTRNSRAMNVTAKENSKNATESAEKIANSAGIRNASETSSTAAIAISTGVTSISNTGSTINPTMTRPRSTRLAAKRRRTLHTEESGQLVRDSSPVPSLNSRVSTAILTESAPSGNGQPQGGARPHLPITHFELFDNGIHYEVHVNRPDYGWRIKHNKVTIQRGSRFIEANVEDNVFEFEVEHGYGQLYQFSDHNATPDDAGYFKITANHVLFKISFKPNYSFEIRPKELVLFRDEPFFFVGAISIPTDTFPLIMPYFMGLHKHRNLLNDHNIQATVENAPASAPVGSKRKRKSEAKSKLQPEAKVKNGGKRALSDPDDDEAEDGKDDMPTTRGGRRSHN